MSAIAWFRQLAVVYSPARIVEQPVMSEPDRSECETEHPDAPPSESCNSCSR